MTRALNSLLAMQEEDRKAREDHNATTSPMGTDPRLDNNPLLGFIMGHGGDRANMTETETPLQEGSSFPTRNGAPCPLQIPILNPPINSYVVPGSQGGEEDQGHVSLVQKQKAQVETMGGKLKETDQYKALEERLKPIEGFKTFGVDALGMCLVPNVVIPHKFKTPDFEKYKGLKCPRNHLKMFCIKMAAYSHDDKLMIHYFQDSLIEASLDWYMQLERAQIRTWEELDNHFLRKYQYNLDMDPNCMQLQNLAQKYHESFKEYAQR